ncbi:MAG: hypothetical protein IJ390_00330 [Lachnospiraceae bacterium]|nr:hypothetical protein [Lachnospiraceae bacterium]
MKDKDYNIPENMDYTTTASFTDCTGLIPTGSVKEEMLDAYRELYPFGAPEPPASNKD